MFKASKRRYQNSLKELINLPFKIKKMIRYEKRPNVQVKSHAKAKVLDQKNIIRLVIRRY